MGSGRIGDFAANVAREVVAKLSHHGVANEDILRDLAELDIVVYDLDRNQAERAGL